MAGFQIIKVLPIGQGVRMNVLHDPSQPTDSLDRWATEVVAEGKKDDDIFSVPVHWHKYHSERITVLEGRIEITLGWEKRIVKAGDEAVLIPRYTRHGFKSFKGERAVMREIADPAGPYKAEFFNDFLGEYRFRSFWHVVKAFYDGDAYMSLPLYFKFFDVIFITVMGGIAKLFLPATKPLGVEK